MEKINYQHGGLNCAETIIDTYNKRNQKEIPVSIGSGMGGGLTVGSVCGAVNAAMAVIGIEKGREFAEHPNEAREFANKFIKKIRSKYGSELCLDLKKQGVSCTEIVDVAYEMLHEVMNEK